jgi:hypothetical protein
VSAPIEEGYCYRDPDDGEIARVLGPADGPGWRTRTLVAGKSGLDVGAEFSGRILHGWARVPDPTLAVIVIDDESSHDEAARQERIDATARAFFVSLDTVASHAADRAYDAADSLEGARERYIEKRKGGAKS